MRHRFGWLPDTQHHTAPLHRPAPAPLPKRVDLRRRLPQPWNQGPIESCTAHALAAALHALHRIEASRLALYWAARAVRGRIAWDSGAMLHHAVKGLERYGVVEERRWPYRPVPPNRATGRFLRFSPPARRPPIGRRLAVHGARVERSLAALKSCLAAGHPVVFGFWAHASFWDQAGRPRVLVPEPAPHERRRGGHAVAAVGYDDAVGAFLIRNSWGPRVQQGGHFWIPYPLMLEPRLCVDHWILRQGRAAR